MITLSQHVSDLKKFPYNRWFDIKKGAIIVGRVYLRNSHYRLLNGEKKKQVLDMSSIEIEEQYRNQGIATELITTICKIARIEEYSAVYIENAINPAVRTIANNLRFKKIDNAEHVDCFYKII